MSTLKNLVDETTVIKNELKTCHINLKNNLVAKGVECSDTDKIPSLIEKVKNISNFLPNNSPIALEALNLGTMPDDVGWCALADDKLITLNYSSSPYKSILDLSNGNVENKIQQGSSLSIANWPSIFGNHTLDNVYCKYFSGSSALANKLDLNTFTLTSTGIQTGFLNQFGKTYRIGDKIYCFASTTSKAYVRVYDTTTATNTLLVETDLVTNGEIIEGGVAYDGNDCLYSFGRRGTSNTYPFNLWKYTISTNKIEHLKTWEASIPYCPSYSKHDLGKVIGRKLYVFPYGTNTVTSQVFSIDLDTFEIVENIFGIRKTYPSLFSCNDNHVVVYNYSNTPYQLSYVHFKNK